MKSVLTKKQTKSISKVISYYDEERLLEVMIRYDDSCGNGHNTFSITGNIHRNANPSKRDRQNPELCGCIHDIITQHMPELEPLLKWHLCSSDGPLHYIANTIYHASERDYNGLLRGEKRQLINGRTKQPVWELKTINENGDELDVIMGYRWEHSNKKPELPPEYYYAANCVDWIPVWQVGKGKEQDLEAARSCAIWPNATASQLQDIKALKARLPSLLQEFKNVIESLGFVF